MSAVLTIIVILQVGLVWHFICNERTFRERTWLVNRAFAARDWPVRAAMLRKVSYSDHLWRRFFLLDPFKLYSPRIWE